jgi:hypothetical protein
LGVVVVPLQELGVTNRRSPGSAAVPGEGKARIEIKPDKHRLMLKGHRHLIEEILVDRTS